MVKKIIATFLIISMLCSSVFAGNFNVKLEKIYTSGNKMLISWEDGKKSALLIPIGEESKPTVNVTTHFKTGGMYPVYYPDNEHINIIVYDDYGNTQKFIDDTANRLKIQAEADAQEAQKQSELRAAEEVPWAILGITIGILLVVAIVKAVDSTDTTSTTK